MTSSSMTSSQDFDAWVSRTVSQFGDDSDKRKQAERLVIKAIINGTSPAGSDPENSLIPSESQVAILRLLKHNGLDLVGHGYGISNSEWVEAVTKEVLFATDNMLAKFDDQMERANSLLTEMRYRGITTLRTMDGHGRFLWCFLKAIKDSGLDPNDYKIEVYDILKRSTDWHNEFFPSGCVTETDDISSLEKHDDDKFEDISSVMFYLNFCSLGGEKGRKKVADMCRSLIELGAPGLMLSFLTRNWKLFSKGFSGGRFISYITRSLKADLISHHTNFCSYWIPPFQASDSSETEAEGLATASVSAQQTLPAISDDPLTASSKCREISKKDAKKRLADDMEHTGHGAFDMDDEEDEDEDTLHVIKRGSAGARRNRRAIYDTDDESDEE